MFITTFFVSALMFINASSNTNTSYYSPIREIVTQSVVFRSTQKLRSSDGRELFFYTSGKCDGFDGDRREFSCKYTLSDGEVRLLDEKGNTVYKGTYRMKSDGQNLSNVTIAGTTYWAK